MGMIKRRVKRMEDEENGMIDGGRLVFEARRLRSARGWRFGDSVEQWWTPIERDRVERDGVG
ncbi:MAG: hypothetical protein IPN90_13380 [Elusimicrobia bacterium]|nr:hypothetical protein [Elusimicrobiota bacterium]